MAEENNSAQVVSASVSGEQKKYMEDNDLSATALVQGKINELKDSDEVPYKYTPTRFLSESRKMGLIIMLAGALILTISMGVFSYLWLTGRLHAFIGVWLAGAVIVYYGAREYTKWNDIMYWRSKADEKAEEKNRE